MKLFSAKRLKLACLSLLSVLVSGSLWTCSTFASDETLGTPMISRISANFTFYEDLQIDYYVTSSGQSGTFTLTGTFDLPDGSSVSADPVYSGTCLPASGTSVSSNQQSCQLTPRVNGVNTTYGHHESEISWDDSASLTLTGSMPSSSEVVIRKVSYTLVQRVSIAYNMPVKGNVTLQGTYAEGHRIRTVRNPAGGHGGVSYYGSGTSSDPYIFTFYNYGSPELMIDILEFHFEESALPWNGNDRIVNWNMDSLNQSGLIAYEDPVKDVGSHNLLQKILDALLNNNDNGAAQQQVNEIKDTAENKMGGISDATELVEQGFENLQGDAVNKLTFPGLFGGDSWTLDLGYIEQQAPELVAIMRSMLIAAVAWGCYEMLKNTVLGSRV